VPLSRSSGQTRFASDAVTCPFLPRCYRVAALFGCGERGDHADDDADGDE
jgi:hypothetical protein